MLNRIDLLAVGYSRCDSNDSSIMLANCTSTLVRTSGGCNVIVDTMTSWDGDYILDALARYELQPKDIDYVICTHGHSDHTGCNYLFPSAKWHIVGNSISHHNKYKEWNNEQPYQLCGEDIVIHSTPGHTLSCVSVLVRNTNLGNMVGICGDLFECEKDIWNEYVWLAGGSEDIKKQMSNRLKMLEICNVIIPGHGDKFTVTDEMRAKLKNDLQDRFPVNNLDEGPITKSTI